MLNYFEEEKKIENPLQLIFNIGDDHVKNFKFLITMFQIYHFKMAFMVD